MSRPFCGLPYKDVPAKAARGEFIFGVKPSAKLVSGFLLPRFDATGQGDETSDIHIATMGIDLQVAAERSGEIVVVPDLSIYVRMLPTWEDVDPTRDTTCCRGPSCRAKRGKPSEDRARADISMRRLPRCRRSKKHPNRMNDRGTPLPRRNARAMLPTRPNNASQKRASLT